MFLIWQQLFILYIFLLIGYFFGKKKPDLLSHSPILSFLVVNLFLPCKMFGTFANHFSLLYLREKYPLLLIAVGFLLFLHLFAKLPSKLLAESPYERKVYEYSSVISNYGYLGYSLAEGIWGGVKLADFMFFAVPFSLYTYTVGYAKLTGGEKDLRRLFNPVTVASFLGMAFGLTGWTLPQAVATAVSSSSACVGPISMLLSGLVLSSFSLKTLFGKPRVYVMTAIRLLGIPLLVVLLSFLPGLSVARPYMMLIAVLPAGLNPIVFAQAVGLSPESGARVAFLSHLFSCVTIPLWLLLI